MLFIILWTLAAVTLIGGGTTWIYFGRKGKPRVMEEVGFALTLIGAVLLIVSICLAVALLIEQTNSAARLEAFYRTNAQNYATTIEKTEDMLTVSLEAFTEGTIIPIEGSIEKWELGTAVSNRIAEWRDAINQYNTGLATYQRYDRNPWLGLYWPDLPDELTPITIK